VGVGVGDGDGVGDGVGVAVGVGDELTTVKEIVIGLPRIHLWPGRGR
jgi:hypothetical protein